MAPKSKTQQPDFVFLSYAPHPNRKSQAAQETQRRAHAARKSHALARQRRGVHTVVDSNSSQEGSSSSSPESAKNSPPKESTANDVIASQIIDSYEHLQDVSFEPVFQPNQNHDLQIWSAGRQPAATLLGQGTVDPFDSFAVKGLPSYVYKVLDIAGDMKWGNLKPSVLNQRSNPLKRAWLRANMESPAVLHAMVYGMLVSLETVNAPVDNDKTLSLRHQTHAITLLQKELKSLGERMPHQNLLLALITLAAHGEPLRGQYNPPLGYPESPMAKTQNLHIYGLMKLVPQHTEAIYMILERIGGIEAVTLYGLRDTLEFCDLYFSTRFGTAPRLTYRHPTHPVIPDIEYVPDMMAEQLLLRSGRSLVSLSALTDDYIEVIQMSCALLAGIDQYQRETDSAPSLPSLVRARTAVQHRLTSLPPIDLLMATFDDQVSEICRISLLIFSNMVFFPVPETSGINNRLVTDLRHSIDTTDDNFLVQHLGFLTWALVIGGIAAFSTANRPWFAATFRKKLLWQACDWDEVRSVLEGHLWWDYVCEDPGKIFWKEVHAIHHDVSLPSSDFILPFYGGL